MPCHSPSGGVMRVSHAMNLVVEPRAMVLMLLIVFDTTWSHIIDSSRYFATTFRIWPIDLKDYACILIVNICVEVIRNFKRLSLMR